MKIIEAQSAMLTNYEVYKHLSDQKQRHDALILDNVYAEGDRESVEISRKKNMKTRPPNFLAVTKGVLEYFEEAPSPLSTEKGNKPIPYNDDTIKDLLDKLRKFALTKAEILMIMNLRPSKPESLVSIVEQFETRFEEAEQQEMVDLILEVLGRPDGEAERQAMQDNAVLHREREQDEEEARLRAEQEEEEDDEE